LSYHSLKFSSHPAVAELVLVRPVRTLFLLTLISWCICSCTIGDTGPDYSHTKPGYYGGDGSSAEQAVIAVGVDKSPYAWIAQKYPGSTILVQGLVVPPPGKKRYDVYVVRLRNGKEIRVWFLISGGVEGLLEDLQKIH
jgi:hypothetical protein